MTITVNSSNGLFSELDKQSSSRRPNPHLNLMLKNLEKKIQYIHYFIIITVKNGKKSRTQTFSETGGVAAVGGKEGEREEGVVKEGRG